MSIATEIERIKIAKESIINTLKANDVQIEDTATIDELNVVMNDVPILDTSDATATAEDIANGKTAYVNGEKILGTGSSSDCNAKIDTNGVTKFTVLSAITQIKDVDFSNCSSISFSGCSALKEISSKINTSQLTSIREMFYGCISLEEIPEFTDTSNVTTMYQTFLNCSKITEIPQLQTSNVTTFYQMCLGCSALISIPLLDCSSSSNMRDAFGNNSSNGCTSLVNIGGFLNLGKDYTKTTQNNTNYILNLSYCPNLSHESLMNVINSLYDLNLAYSGTLYTQSLVLGGTNIAKLTSEEIAIATSKGWNVS